MPLISSFSNKNREDLLPSRPYFSFWTSAKKIGRGITFWGLGYAVNKLNEVFLANDPESKLRSPAYLSKAIGYSLCADGLFEISEHCLFSFYMHLAQSISVDNKHQKKSKKQAVILRQDFSLQESEHYNGYLRIWNILKSSIALIVTIRSFIKACNTALYLRGDISHFGFSIPTVEASKSSGIFSFLKIPIIRTLSIPLYFLGILYNSNEILLSFKSPLARRGDIPCFGLINALGVTAEMASLLKSIAIPISVPQGASEMDMAILAKKAREEAILIPIYFRSVIAVNILAYYQIFNNARQMFLNAVDIFFEDSNIVLEITEPTVFRHSGNKTKNLNFTHELLPKPIPNPKSNESDEKNEDDAAKISAFDANETVSELQENTESSEKKQKFKTKGIPDPSYQNYTDSISEINPLALQSQAVEEFYPIDEDLRLETLDNICQLRDLSQIPKQRIFKKLEELRKLLPKGTLEGVDGSEHHLFWVWHKKNYHIKFEGPHGSDHNQFKGKKLEKVLNVLEAGILWGWNKNKIEEHLQQRNKGRSLEKLRHVFEDRPKL